MGKAKTKKNKNTFRHNPLDKQILESRFSQPSSRQKIRNKVSKDDKCGDALASGILKIASEQQQEEETNRFPASSDIDLHSPLGSNDAHSSLGSNDVHSSLGSNDVHSSLGSNDVHSSLGSNDVHSSLGSKDCHSPMVSNDCHSPVVSNDRQSPMVSSDRQSPIVSSDRQSPMVSNDRQSPMVSNDPRSPVVSNDPRSPVGSNDRHSSVVSNDRHSSMGSNDLSQNDDVEEEEYAYSYSEDDKMSQTAVEISEEEEEAFKKFNCAGVQERKTLADVIKEILTEKKTEICTAYSDAGTDVLTGNEEAYKEITAVLKNYRSGKLPKEFKLFPNFFDWESRLCHTKPDEWSSAAMFQATRIFSSNLGDKGAQRFFNKILLPRCRDEVAESKFLNFHLYQALKKALFKPSAFFKGIIIPLCKDSYCTRREATIFGSILSKCSIPVLHSSAALLTIAALNYQASNSIFMRTLIEKKYALPNRVVNGVVDHFLRFMENNTEVHLVWHHCLLTFVQMYKIDLSAEQKNGLLKLLTVHHHEHVTPEIRKELQETVSKAPKPVEQLWKI